MDSRCMASGPGGGGSAWLMAVVTILDLAALRLASPAPSWNPQSAAAQGFGRNIRHLPCVSRRSGETGICMFAFSCAKANGTHLGTCIDRFYFGSCCKLAQAAEDETLAAEPLDTNHIDDAVGPTTERYRPPLSTYQSVLPPRNATDQPTSTTARYTPELSSTSIKPSSNPSTSRPSVSTHSPVTSPWPSSKPTHKPTPIHKPPSNHTVIVTKPPAKPPSKPPAKPPTKLPTKPPSKPPAKPPAKPPPTAKPTLVTKPKPVSQKPTAVTKPPKPPPSKRPTQTAKPAQQPSVKPSSSKPPLQPISATDPTYVQVPVMTVPTSSSPPLPSSSVSNDIVPAPRPTAATTANVTGNVEHEEESSNVIQEGAPSPPTPSPTTQSTLLVTWTTVDQVPQTPPRHNSTRPVSNTSKQPLPTTTSITSTSTTTTTTTTTSTTQATKPATQTASEDWVEVAISTPSPTVSDSTKPETTTHTHKPTISISTHEPVSTTMATPPMKPPVPSQENSTASPETNSTSPTVEQHPNTTEMTPPAAPAVPVVPDINVNMSDYQDVCGRRLFPQSRIVGGQRATFGKWPWQISLRQWRTSTYLHKCGAALLNENWAITAAHCVENVAPSDLLLRLGEHDLSVEDEPFGYQERRVQIVASHPQFDPRTFEYDLALLRFYEPVKFQPNIIPVCVPQDDTDFVGSSAFVTGWGRLYEDGPLPSVLQEVSVPVINNSVCETMYRAAGYIEHIPEIFICAGWKKGGFDSCEGDSGGPMVIQRPDHRWLLAGVISWGIGCAEPNQPGVYTRISQFRGWINQILQF